MALPSSLKRLAGKNMIQPLAIQAGLWYIK